MEKKPKPVKFDIPGGPYMVDADDRIPTNWSIKRGETPETTTTIESGVGVLPLLEALSKLKETTDDVEKHFGPKGGRKTRKSRRHLRKTRRSRK